MILRPLKPIAAGATTIQPAWDVVQRIEKETCQGCWIITQPSHAALAGEMAASLRPNEVPKLEAELVRAIALHDAGWGMPDAQAVMQSRAVQQSPPKSFLQVSVQEFVAAWTQSIEIAQSTSAAGEYIVSRHFWRLAQHRLSSSNDPEAERGRLKEFVSHETARQEKLVARQKRSPEELETITDVLQFCDLLSLYICCGAQESVEFPEYFAAKARLSVHGDEYKLDPPLIEPGCQFFVAALRHPATKEVSSQKILVRIG